MMSAENMDKRERRSLWQLAGACSGTAFDRRNYFVFILWLMAWAATQLVATRLLQQTSYQTGLATWILLLLPTASGIVALLAYLRFLRLADGMLRQVQLDGLAFGFGASVVVALGYRVFEYAGAPEMQVSHVVMIMMIGWATGMLRSMCRYR